MQVIARPQNEAKVKKRRNRPTTLRGWLIFGARILIFLFVVLYIAISIGGANLFTHSPNRGAPQITPAYYGLLYQDVEFPADQDGLKIRGWYVAGAGTQAIVVVHGKDGNRTSLLEQSVPLAQAGFSLLLIDMRGHGQSDGDHYTYGYYEQRDVIGAVNWLKSHGFDPAHIGIYGASMGASSGLLAMGKDNDIHAMVSDSAYARLSDELDHGYKLITGDGTGFFLPGIELTASLLYGIDINAIQPEESVKRLGNRRLLLIQGTADNLVPVENSYRLKAAAGNQAELWNVAGADHVQSYQKAKEEYIARLVGFFRSQL